MKNERDRPSIPEETGAGVIKCEDVQSLLLAYMARELGEARSDLVREHIRRCPVCRVRAAELQETVDLLHAGSAGETGWPEFLSEKHRARLIRAVTHPVLDWIYVHHMLVSILVALAVILTVLAGLRRYRLWRTEQTGPGIEVKILDNKPPVSEPHPPAPR